MRQLVEGFESLQELLLVKWGGSDAPQMITVLWVAVRLGGIFSFIIAGEKSHLTICDLSAGRRPVVSRQDSEHI